MKTLCVAKCKNHEGICRGCLRTMKEISEWRLMNDEAHTQTIAQIQGTKTTHDCILCGQPAYCGVEDGKQECWCFELAKRDTSGLPKGQCVCRACLSGLPLLQA
ncbi:cysteine-rich CWC family protein [Photobacterium galatheae]|uniref:cysteine-rich CWC family protein n=1 Tax=Photobacterium galatheae TaxID=1654360 RepID=UPI0009DFB0A8|nr:cysteine-rich CWC family protein [Photobacterium galatheae]MCM0149906.1 cysteine-rich CWC family protein [Photobacterium galatheae]